jgi:hypothetical protein
LQHINENGSYSAQQIYNIDETTVFRKGWLTGLDSQVEKYSLRFQAAEQRFTLLLGGNDEEILHWGQWCCPILHNLVL